MGIRLAFLLFLACAVTSAALPADVVPINWSRFTGQPDMGVDGFQALGILRNATRYNLACMPCMGQQNTDGDMILPPNMEEYGIRPGASALYGAAVLIKTGGYDDHAMGMPRADAITLLRKIAKGLAYTHKVNSPTGKGWGDQWQSAHWASMLGEGVWILWDEMDPQTRAMTQKLVEHEADRFIAPGYKVPYWTSPDGHVNTPGDTKAEENSWNSMILQVAVAMMPGHPHAAAWKRAGSELMISAFSMKADLENPTVVDGKPVEDWLNGYNVRDDGAVINHNIVHPDYTTTSTLQLRTYTVQSLAGQTISQAAAWNARYIYRQMSLHAWPAPPYQAPGGPMYIPNKAEVYYPQGTDWSRFRFDIYYLFDTFADILGWDAALPTSANQYMRLRGARLLSMEARHADGHTWEPSEAPSGYPNDTMLAWQMGDAYLMLWLKAHNALSPVGNWLAPSGS